MSAATSGFDPACLARSALLIVDMQRGFIRAEVVPWQELVAAGGYAGARERGTLRVEGRNYVMADGDVITVKFTLP